VQREMERRELGAQVQTGIDKLSPDLRTCVILRDIEELELSGIVGSFADTGRDSEVAKSTRAN